MSDLNTEKLTTTAAPVVYGRTFSDIQYNKEIAKLCRTETLTSDAYKKTNRLIAPYIEARFKALTNLLAESGIKNIIEIASGLSPRGLIVTEDKTINYIETDQSGMIQQKEKILRELLKQEKKDFPKNLQFAELNVLDKENFKAVIAKFPMGPVAIGHEGLLAHLTREERIQMGQTIKEILKERGGIWITPDIFTAKQLEELLAEGQGQKVTEDVVKNTGRNYHDNAFQDIDAAKRFFSDLGFKCSIQTLGETAGNLASIKIGLTKQSIRNQLALNIWNLTSIT